MAVDGDLIAGIDIGGTKTHILVGRGDDIVSERVVPSVDWRSWDRRKDAVALSSLIRDVAGRDLAAIAIGAHGCDADWQCKQLEADLGDHLAGRIMVVNDSELLLPAAGYFSGIGVVSGTGSIAVARKTDGTMLVAGGWGWILGDEGSAAATVREAARAVRGSLDRGEAGDPLVEALMKALETSDPTKIGRLLNDTRSAVTWGRYADAVFEAAAQQSSLALRVINEGGQALAGLVGTLAARGADASNIVIGGGVVVEQPILLQAFEGAIASISPISKVTLLREAPVIGALALARHSLHTPAGF
jgi:glucosamine kinase